MKKSAIEQLIVFVAATVVCAVIFTRIDRLVETAIDDHRKIQSINADEIKWCHDSIGHTQWWDSVPLLQGQHELEQATLGLSNEVMVLQSRIEKLENPAPTPSFTNYAPTWITNFVLTNYFMPYTVSNMTSLDGIGVTNQTFQINGAIISNATFYNCSNSVQVTHRGHK